jgi:hypothetical protein
VLLTESVIAESLNNLRDEKEGQLDRMFFQDPMSILENV